MYLQARGKSEKASIQFNSIVLHGFNFLRRALENTGLREIKADLVQMEFSNAATRGWSLLPGHRVSRKPLSGVGWYLEVPNPCFPGRSWSKAQCSRKKTLDFQATPDEGRGVKLGLYGLCFGSATSARLGTPAPSHPYPRPTSPSVETPIPLLPGDVRASAPPTGVGCQSRMTAPN